MNIEELPLEDIVGIINNMDYRSIINLSQTSSEFNRLIKTNDVVADIVYGRKLRENSAGRLEYVPAENIANIYLYLGDELKNQKFEIAFQELEFSSEDLQGIITDLEEGEADDYISFGDGTLYYDNTVLPAYLSYGVEVGHIFSVALNKNLFVRLLKEYKELLRTRTSACVYIRNDGSVDKIIS